LLQSLFKSYQQALSATKRGASPPQAKKRDEDVLVQTGSGPCLRLGAFGARPGCDRRGRSNWLNAQVHLPSIGWISCRLGEEQPLGASEYWVEGVSLRREADGWYAAIRQHVVPREAPLGSGVCGIDVGLVNLFAAASDDGSSVVASNPRKGESMRRRPHTPHGYIELIAMRQAAQLPVSKLQCRSARHVREVIRRELFPFTDRHEFIGVEDLPPDIGQRGLPHLSFMRTIRTMLIDRYGRERVIDVDPAGTSRICSACGKASERSWSSLPGRVGSCACGHSEDSDTNAARNVMARAREAVANRAESKVA
jgi:transposase